VEATIMTKENIQVKGYINYLQWRKSPQTIDFFKSQNSNKTILTPKNTLWVKVANDYYISREIIYTKSPRNTSNISFNTNNPQYTKTAFCIVIMEGEITLYEYTDEWATKHYYIEGEENNPIELIYYKYYKKVGSANKKIIIENKKYQGQLAVVLSDCEVVKKIIKSAPYTSKGISNIIEKYNECKGHSPSYTKKKEEANFRFGLLTGVSITTVYFNSKDSKWDLLTKSNQNVSINPLLGASITIIPERGLGKWSIYGDLMYRGQYFNGSYTDYHNDEYYTNYDYYFGTTSIRLNGIVKYNFIGKKIVPYVGAGFLFGLNIAYQNQVDKDKYFYNTNTKSSSELFEEWPNLIDYGLSTETGINFQHFNFGLRYNIGIIGEASSITHNFNFILSYIF